MRGAYRNRRQSLPLLTCGLLAANLSAQQEPVPLRDLDAADAPYRTPRSGEGVRGSVFGTPLEVAPRDRRSVAAWQAGFASTPGIGDNAEVPFGSLFFLEHPDDTRLLRASVVGVYNELFYARTAPDGSELVVTFESYTLPWSTAEAVDGEVDDREQVEWGYVRPGLGFGWRTRVAPFEHDNMAAADLLVEPGLLYFGRGDRTDATFVLPESTFELRVRLQLRLDAVERNLLELPHAGHALGADVVYGWRAEAGDWGLPGRGLQSAEHDYVQCSAYAYGITGVPGITDERHRLFASVHGGIGEELDRFSAQRVGGGPDLRGEEFATSARPGLPGAAVGEFFPDHYLIAAAGYRCEVAFFAHVDVGATVAWLDRDRLRNGAVARENDVLTALSARLSTGFVARTRLQLGYAYGFDVVRDGERGGHEFVLLVTGRF